MAQRGRRLPWFTRHDVLDLHARGVPLKAIARALGLARNTVRACVRRDCPRLACPCVTPEPHWRRSLRVKESWRRRPAAARV
jgi:hypothetical protein